ncbi:ABC transporter substrate-binding protein [Pseudonocardia sp. WMMC193]|uniref:ABC transporter substrate-binding protein n=1 Tax=Pseudonocardia sp. WMMC193 TaxID=2911965 RepID=UPI001F1E2C2A|nr:ABC transporter substrate-binding protein [Pseudonocardia sp. WMMC193]MCF7550526.1 ABC transporter substrate-binding protein [Pseudonocardia sp. WMMC193]
MRRIRLGIRAVATALLLALVAACAPLSSGGGGRAGGPSGPADPDAIFGWAHIVGLSRFDPHRATSSYDNTFLFLTYDRLVHVDYDLNPVPGLATSWEFSPDGKALDLRLREGVTFHDGTPFDAAAVKANIERAKTVEGSSVRNELAAVQSVEVTGPSAVRLVLSTPNAALLGILSDRAGAMVSPAAFDNPDLDQAPVGAGMFRVTSYQPQNKIEYRRVEGYWDPAAVKVGGVDMYIYVDPATRLNALRTGEIDGAAIAPDQVPEAEAAGLRLERGRSNNFYFFHPNRARSEFGRVEVRQALAHAINRKALVDSVFRGYGTVSEQPLPDWSFAHNADLPAEPHPYDPERARQLLAQAGLPNGFTFEALIPTSPDSIRIAEAVQADLKAVGVTMTTRVMEGQQLTDVFFARKEGDLLMGSGGGRADPAQTTQLRYMPTGFNNPSGISTPTIERLQAEVLATTDQQQRAAIFRQMMQEVSDQVLDGVLFYPQAPVALSGDVLTFRPALSDRPEFRGVEKAGPA